VKQNNKTTEPTPRRELPFACSRRSFLPALLRETIVTLDMSRGGRGGRLSDLGKLSDDELARIKPLVNPAYEILVQDDQVWARYRATDKVVRLFAAEEKANLVTFNLFDGRHSLGEIGKRLAKEMGWDMAQGFAHTRDLFLTLVSHLVCLPKDPPPDGQSPKSDAVEKSLPSNQAEG
jgi:hypothetical protein